MRFNKKNEMTTDTKTNYEDQERVKLEQYVSENKHILEPKKEDDKMPKLQYVFVLRDILLQ